MLALVVQCTVGLVFYEGTWRGLRGGCRMGMDTLVALGTSVAYGSSVLELALYANGVAGDDGSAGRTKPATFFDTPALLLTFVSLGKLLEVLARTRTSAAVTELLRLRPESAIVLELLDGVGSGDVDGDRENESGESKDMSLGVAGALHNGGTGAPMPGPASGVSSADSKTTEKGSG